MIGKDFLDKYNLKQAPPSPELPANRAGEETTAQLPGKNEVTTNDNRMTTNDLSKSLTPNPKNLNPDLESLIHQIESSAIDITSPYDTWLRILFAISDYSGESGRDYAHRISRFHPGYSSADCDKQYTYCLRAGKSGITISTLFYIAQQHGILIQNHFSEWSSGISIPLPAISIPEVPLSFLQREGSGVSSFESEIPNPRSSVLSASSAFQNNSAIRHPQSDILPFPTEIFPPSISTFITTASKSIGCPPDFIGVPVLTVLATAIGSSRSILLKNGFIEGPRMYAAIIAEPGGKKTPALRKATIPILERQKVHKTEYNLQKEEFTRILADYQNKLDIWKRAKPSDRNPDDHPVEPPHPVMLQVKTSDATMEAIAKLLDNNPRGILFEQDELAAWVKSMNAYRSGRGSDLENWLSLWSGEQITINRKSSPEPTLIFNPIVNVIGCIQPDLLEDLSGIKQNGFFDRILFAFPEPLPHAYSEDEISDEIIETYCNTVNKLFDLQSSTDAHGNQNPVLLRFNQPASLAWRTWNKLHDSEMNDPNLPYYFKGPWAKLRSYMGRFILILQLAHHSENNNLTELIIHPESVEKAASLVEYFKSHIRKVYGVLFNSEMDRKVVQTVNWINRHGGSATVRMLLNSKVANSKSVSQIRELLEEMVDRRLGTLTSSTPLTGGRPLITFTLNNSAIAQK